MLTSSACIIFLFITTDHFVAAAPLPRSFRPTRNFGLFCGNRDDVDAGRVRVRRSIPGEFGVLAGKTLRYGVLRYPRHALHQSISQRDLRQYVDEALRKAIKLWGEAIDVKFVEWQGRGADIEISFWTFYHGDEYPFDGVGNEVAHAFYPNHEKRRGQIHIDDNEPWGPNGRNLNWVIAHEVGHSLGLSHTLRDSIMMPQYGGFEEVEPHLFPYDINAIQALYGKKKGFEEAALLKKQNAIEEIPEAPSLCDGKPVDTIFALPNSTLVVFKGADFWRLGNVDNTSQVGPLPIRDFFGQLPLPLDAAFTDHFDWTWFIKGDRAWRVDASTDRLRLFAPEEFHETAPFTNYIYSSVDAVLSMTTSSKIDDSQSVFFFLGPKYWLDGNSGGITDAGYYRQIREIDQRLKKVDAAISLPNGNFIFSNDSYWKVNPTRNSLKAEKGYPRSVSRDWFECR